MRSIVVLGLLACSTTYAAAQAPLRLEGFGFGAAVITHRGVEPAAQLSAAALLRIAGVPIEASVGSSVAELKALDGAQRDRFLSAVATRSVTRYFLIGGGVAVHSLSARISGAGSDSMMRAVENSESGTRPALVALGALNVPLAPGHAAALRLGARSDFMRGLRRLSFGLSVALRPGRGRLTLGERIVPPVAPTEQARTWEAIVQEIVQLEGQLPVGSVQVARDGLRITFAAVDEQLLRDAVARVARILSGAIEPIRITIAAPVPARIAAAATAGGFPAERITLLPAEPQVTLQVIRPPGALSFDSVQP